MKRIALSSWLAVALACVTIGAGASAALAEPVKIRWGVVGTATPSDITPILFANKAILKHYGKSYTVETTNFRGTTLMVPALAAKELDFAMVANSSLAFAILNAKLDVKVVADELQEGVPGWFSGTWYVLEGSPVRQACDLKGKSIALGAKGTGLDLALRVMMKKTCNFAADRDYTIVEVGFPNQEAFLRDKKVDATVMIPPFVHGALAKGGIRAIFNNGDAIGRSQFLVQIARTEFLAQHRAAVQDLMEDYLIAWRWYLDPKNVEQANQYAAAFTKLPVTAFQGWAWLPEKDYYRDPWAMPDLEALQKDMRLMHEHGLIAESVDVKKHADLSFIQKAKERVNP